MGNDLPFTDEEVVVNEGLGYPKAYAKLCRDRSFEPFSRGPPFTFTPYALVQQEDSRAKELDEIFPVIDPKAKPRTKTKIFLSLLWKQLNHLGNAGFDPDIIRVDPYGNVLYYYADPASPLAWDIDHWFPCSRGGLSVPSNLRILQWQVCKRKHHKLEFLMPWWDLQLGIPINQFLSIFASSNSDFRQRAFSWLFPVDASQTVHSHTFPKHYKELVGELGLAPAAVVLSQSEPSDDAPLKSLDVNRRHGSSTPMIAAKKIKRLPKENESPIAVSDSYQTIVMARDSLKQREETGKMQTEIQKLDNEVCELLQKTEEEKFSIQELELLLTRKRRQAEKCRRLAESQSSYRAMLEKMIRDAMHQTVVYKEQVRLNQAAASALLATLEAQKAICDSAERDLCMKYKQRDELEKQIRPEWEHGRKRARMDDFPNEEGGDKIALYLPGNEPKKQLVSSVAENGDTTVLCLPEIKELGSFMEEEERISAAGFQRNEMEPDDIEEHRETADSIRILKPNVNNKKEASLAGDDSKYKIGERYHDPEVEEEEEEEEKEIRRRQHGKGAVEKWLQVLLENTLEGEDFKPQCTIENETDEINEVSRSQERLCIETGKVVASNSNNEETSEAANGSDARKSISADGIENKGIDINRDNGSSTPFKNPPYRIVHKKIKTKELPSTNREARSMNSSPDEIIRRADKLDKEREMPRSDSARVFRRIPSSPSLILQGMKKRVQWIGRKK